MIYIQMYSYKGGSGRTVSTANICSILANKKQKVLLIDLDIESAGLNYVLRNTNRNCIKVQDIINDCFTEHGTGEVKNGLRDAVFTRMLFKNNFFEKVLTEVTENLFFIPARYSNLDAVTWKTATNLDRFIRRLNAYCKKQHGFVFDFVFFDSPSGLQSWARNIFERCFLVIFFRWSRQFTKGTVEFMQNRFHIQSSPNSWRIPPGALLVPNAVPSQKDTSDYGMEKLKADYASMISVETRALSAKIADAIEDKNHDFIAFDENGIPECPILKWDEKILSPKSPHEKETYAAYQRIADRLIGLKDER